MISKYSVSQKKAIKKKVRKDRHFCDQIVHAVAILDKKLKISIFFFFNFNSSFF